MKTYYIIKTLFCFSSSAGDETQVNLAIVQASCKDSGVYRCSITNEHGTDSTDLLLSTESMYSFSFQHVFVGFLCLACLWHVSFSFLPLSLSSNVPT